MKFEIFRIIISSKSEREKTPVAEVEPTEAIVSDLTNVDYKEGDKLTLEGRAFDII